MYMYTKVVQRCNILKNYYICSLEDLVTSFLTPPTKYSFFFFSDWRLCLTFLFNYLSLTLLFIPLFAL